MVEYRDPFTVNRIPKGSAMERKPVITPNHPLAPLITLVYDWSRDFSPWGGNNLEFVI